MGLGHRYGRRMQTISGIHYNWSLPGLGNDEYFALIRNFRRHSFVLLVLFGASPAVCPSFVAGREHGLQPLSPHTLHLPHATSLRMGRLGYQSDAQASLSVSYNNLESYAASLHEALTKPYPPYKAIGIRNPGGEYNQLATSLLQIENEFYGTIRPKRTIERGERPLHALRERGVEYVEVRCMDLDPFVDGRHRGADDALHRHLPAALPAVRQPARHARGDRRAGAQPAQHRCARSRAGAAAAAQRRRRCRWPIGAPSCSKAARRSRRGSMRCSAAATTAMRWPPHRRRGARRTRCRRRVCCRRIQAGDGCAYTAFVRQHSAQAQAELLALPWSPEQQALFEQRGARLARSATRHRGCRHGAVRDLPAGLRVGQAVDAGLMARATPCRAVSSTCRSFSRTTC